MSDQVVYGEAICVIGFFDGVHQGHQYLLQQAERQAAAMGLPVVVLTFDRDPDELFMAPEEQRKLLSDVERLQRLQLADCGGMRYCAPGRCDSEVTRAVVALPFEQTLADLSPEDFLNSVLAAQLTARGIHVGADFRFGAQAAGDVAAIKNWAEPRGAEVFGHVLFDDDDRAVTATRIRDALASGQLAEANRLLTRPYHLRGQVVHGRGVGRGIGFPTANIAALDNVMLPADGVYAGFMQSGEMLLPAAISVGVPLTFDGVPASVEVHILDFDADIYEEEAVVYFIEYLRPMIAFDGLEQLTAQITADVERSRQLTSQHPLSVR